ncbi:hypothetical protein A3H80_02425 [Candidatus Roizmanbacteria bacterium RIFCSPLOWO2_02_FULL_37_19]|nr:MAG: hypothetical protein A2862_02010 [Candidatus Roizmanbacteria bacterium RIFCSPHIGHO2_01_FULL_38_41]OGK32819.1 MAG: hypothetical protein A3E10_03455 [Candidatus Roizmanbacteria bacterium RIFCSPHIGHO2_12_FULL_37_23]OGK45181.1 MAG: hypothetical protein A2956_03235 [Candidatus Roizmanbacteria bacterium RIFCSPLOWO2_01_FULL_37_57]OGK53599.1 MAG: hypothetical protein A3H80_02425 [Candidatus Roizmanbacteria bacterium RIFCSPLOWO2_02_FULL_37_19]OGK61258.1 MAG: hypothetical protein A3G65_03975 [Can
MKPKLIIAATGLDGLIGSRINTLLKNDFEFINIPESSMDITDKDKVNEIIGETNFDIFLHLAAYTDVDSAESKQEVVWKINVDGTKNIFEAVEEKGKKMVFISTGFVFDGEHPPYYEDSTRNPISFYGKTKYEGEKIVEGRGMIIRLDYPYGGKVSYKKDIVESIVSGLKQGKEIKGIIDQYFTPTLIDDVAYAVKYLFSNFSPKIFHIVGADSLTGYDIIHTICKVYGFNKDLIGKTTYSEFYKDKALRPKNSILKSKGNHFYTMKSFEEGLLYLKKMLSHI